MKRLFPILFLGMAAFAHAQNPEDEIPNFDLDDFYVEPKFSLSVGARLLNGSSVSFGGQGQIPFLSELQDETATGVVRAYHDGIVQLDARDDATDGKTDTWTVYDEKQLIDDGANVAFHIYSAQIVDSTVRQQDTGSSLGSELVLSRDMGKIGNKFEWKLFAGVGMNGISASARDNVNATVTTVTEVYSLDGQTPPSSIPYSAPSYVFDTDGNVVDTTILLGQHPDSRTTTTVTNNTQVSNLWRLKGTYLTLRLGPTLIYHVTDNFRFTVSAGPALVYSGTTYSVEQTFTPDTGDTVISTVSDSEVANLTGYYVDASMEYLITERAGLYMGAFYQTSGDYSQTITQNGSSYTTDVDLAKLQGFRAGLNFKF